VLPTAALSDATHLMAANNFSQIPVIKGQSDLRGVITWRSVAAMYQNGKPVTVAHAMEPDFPPVAEVHHELFPHLPEVVERGYLLVRSSTGAVQGIVTTADIARRFEVTAVPFFLVGEIELRLRQCFGAKLQPTVIKAVQKYKTGDVSDLTFGEYVRLLKSPPPGSNSIDVDANWQALGWTGMSRDQFVHQLDGVRKVRNAIAHFDDAPVTPNVIAELRSFCTLLKQLT
jgi:CBS domain-containing protein